MISEAVEAVSPPTMEELFRRHGGAVLRTAYRVTGRESDAEDVLQTVFLRLLDKGHLARLSARPGPYLCRAATNAALDLLRRRATAGWVELKEDTRNGDSRDRPDRRFGNRRLRDALRRALAALTPKNAEIFALRYLEGLGNREIAKLMDTSPGVIAVTLHRARRALQVEMQSFLGDEP